VLQDKKFRALGASSEQQANIRIIAATNTQINHLVQAGRFRADLYYRLSVFSIHLPPLRERAEDILPLASYFLKKHALQEGSILQITPAGCEALLRHSWPGNVRELENAIIRGIHHCQTDIIELEDLDLGYHSEKRRPATITQSVGLRSFKEMKQEMITSFERDYLQRLMHQHQGNVSRAVATAGKDRRDLGRLLKKYRIDPKCFRATAESTGEKVEL
jgi:transcriptional regulator with PAS, ATPase and Fis domain